MKLVHTLISGAALLSMGVLGCTSSASSDDSEAASDALKKDWVKACQKEATDRGVTTVNLVGTAYDYMTMALLPGAVFTAPGGATATADSAGHYSLALPVCSDVEVTHSAPGHLSGIWLLRTEAEDIGMGLRFLGSAVAGTLTQLAGGQPDPNTGSFSIPAYRTESLDAPLLHWTGSALSGVSITSSATTGHTYYVGTNGLPSTTLTATTAAGIAGMVNVAPGTYDVTPDVPAGYKCDFRPFTPGTQPGSVRIKIAAGMLSGTMVRCEQTCGPKGTTAPSSDPNGFYKCEKDSDGDLVWRWENCAGGKAFNASKGKCL